MRSSIDIVFIVDKMQRNILRWFGHMMRRDVSKDIKESFRNELCGCAQEKKII